MTAALLARITRHSADANIAEERTLDDTTTTAVLTLLDQGYITSTDCGAGYVAYAATDAGKRVAATFTAAAIAGAPGNSTDSSGDVALWSWLLLNGGELGRYATEPSATPAVAHLLACGLDLAKSGPVRDDVWTVWGGTFGDDGREAGVSGMAACRCGHVHDLSLRATVESVTDLLRQALACG
jgi:hypothetical protein